MNKIVFITDRVIHYNQIVLKSLESRLSDGQSALLLLLGRTKANGKGKAGVSQMQPQ
jgi:hypothetical protein